MINKGVFQDFFKQRMVEIMHKDTLDSYRVRTNNAHTILKELSHVLEGWIAGNIKRFETVEFCVDECLTLLDKDTFLDFSFCQKTIFIACLKEYVTESKKHKDVALAEESKRIIFLIDECLALNSKKYLRSLLDAIRSRVFDTNEYEDSEFSPKLQNFDSELSSFACELLCAGYSKKYLYKFFNSMKMNMAELSFEDAFEQMYEKFTNISERKYKVAIKISFKRPQNANSATLATENIVEAIPADLQKSIGKFKSFVVHAKTVRFYYEEVETLDAYMAAQEAYGHLAQTLDCNQDVICEFALPFYALVFEEGNVGYSVSQEKFFILDNGGQFLKSKEHVLYERLQLISESDKVANEVKDRMTAALRHLRIGDGQVEMEQRFINYWIALEFIFSSSFSKDNTFVRIKEYLVDILSTCYLKRNLLYLSKWMCREHFLDDTTDVVDKINDDAAVSGLTDVLLKYRIKNMKAHIGNNDTVKKYIQNHRNNLLQHISRIYRLRNELVHEAALKQDIENVTSNLRFYLVFVLNQLIGYFSDLDHVVKPKSMLQFFWEYEKGGKCITSADKGRALAAAEGVKIAKSFII